jgi:hypothetical protein
MNKYYMNDSETSLCPILKIHKALFLDKCIANQQEWKITKYSKYIIDNIFWYFSYPPYPVPIVNSDDVSFNNISQLTELGPEKFFSKISNEYKNQPAVQIRFLHKWILILNDLKFANIILKKYDRYIGRGSDLIPFRKMIGDVFFVQNDVSKERARFRKTVNRTNYNFELINQSYNSSTNNSDSNNDIITYNFIIEYIIECIARCFVGIKNVKKLPNNMFETFMECGKEIIKSGIDPLSQIITPNIRSTFRNIKSKMDLFWRDILENNINDIIQGQNYTFDIIEDEIKKIYPEINLDINNIEHLELIKYQINNNNIIRETGPTTMFASMNVARSLFFVMDILKYKKELRDKLILDIKSNININDDIFTIEKLNQMKYLKAVVMESLWHATPIPMFPREILENFELEYENKIYNFKKGNTIILMFRELQQNNLDFNPDKWLKEDAEYETDFLPFGCGTRYCPAKPFAIQIIIQFIVNFIIDDKNFDLLEDKEYTTEYGGIGPLSKNFFWYLYTI